MNVTPPVEQDFAETILEHSGEISAKLDLLRNQRFPPNAQKGLREFSISEVAGLLEISTSYLKKLHLGEKGIEPSTVTARGHRFYTLDKINELREVINRVPHRRGDEKLQVIAVVNFKGGSGKTTTSAHLAQYLALKGYRVLAVDLDPQASLTALFGLQPEMDNKPSFYEALRYGSERRPLSELILQTNFSNLHLVPANLELQEYEYETPLVLQRDPTEGRMFYTRIQRSLAEVDGNYDVVVVDCPPQLGYLTLTALSAASASLITVHPQMLDIMSMSQFLAMLGGVLQTVGSAGLKVKMDWFRYLITRFEPMDIPQQQMVGFMQTMFAQQMMRNHMVKSTAVSDAGLTKQTIYEVERSQLTASTYDRAREAMDSVNGEVLTLITKAWGR